MASYEFFETVAASGSGSLPTLLVQRSPERSCWVSLPPALASQLYRGGGGGSGGQGSSAALLPLVLEVRPMVQRAGIAMPGGEPKYVAWGGACSVPGALGVPAGLLGVLGLPEGRPAALRPLWEVPHADWVSVEPAGEDDWEVVELNAEYLEGQLLTQVGVVSPRQPFPFWVHTHLISLRVVGMEPAGAPAARLVPGTEIRIAPRVRVRPGDSAAGGQLFKAGEQGKQAAAGGGAQQQAARPATPPEPEQPVETALRVQCSDPRTAARCAAEHLGPEGQASLPPSVVPVGIAPATLARCGLREGDWVRVEASGRNSSGSSSGAKAVGRFAALAVCSEAAVGHLALTPEQCAAFGVAPFSHVRVQRLGRAQRALVVEAAELQQQTAANVDAEGGQRAAAAALPAAAPREQGVDEPSQRPRPLASGVEQQQEEDDGLAGASWLSEPLEKAVQALLPVLGATPRCLLQSWGVPRPGGLLVSGPAGSGKSALMAAAARALQRHPQCLAHSVVVSCREVGAEGAGHAQALLSAKVQEALDHMPCLLVLDDLDMLCPAEADGPEAPGSAADPALVAWLCDVLDYLATPAPQWGALPDLASLEGGAAVASSAKGDGGNGSSSTDIAAASSKNGKDSGGARGSNGYSKSNGALPSNGGGASGPIPAAPARLLWPPVAIAATCKDSSALAAPLRAAGRLDHPLALPAPSAESRAAILAVGVRARNAAAAPSDLQSVAERADGFDATDLEVLLDRALHLALRRQLAAAPGPGGRQLAVAQGPPGAAVELTEEDLVGALEGMTPAAFWGVHTQKAVQQGVSGWEDVGGMDDVRAALYEALELPTKHAKLVAQAPLRLRTGVLLYGPPGCGKTHVVSAAVAAANVRCITVSGPELLNKYIGASEAAVRDVFQRAAAAAPAVLFFDEFDAIAPQRGHDNTGVTDRVVNQLLTELDGVEGLRGVCVIAATSRPDLIDAALLRPGRLDRLLYCGFPSPLERGRILAALARSLPLAPDVDLQEVAAEAEFFSGADLSALLSEAQLAAVHETLAAEDAATAAAELPLHKHHHRGGAPTVISQQHLADALAAARPSVPEAERDRLEAIYMQFQQAREPGSSAAVDKGKGKRVSWA